MLKLLLGSLLVFSFSSVSSAHDHSAEVCSEKNSKVCVHLGIHEELTSEKEGQFIIHAMPADGGVIQNLQADLWMDMGSGHGHGSAPLTITQSKPNIYFVTNAWFIMMGEWQVRMQFELNGETHQIIIPVYIKK